MFKRHFSLASLRDVLVVVGTATLASALGAVPAGNGHDQIEVSAARPAEVVTSRLVAPVRPAAVFGGACVCPSLHAQSAVAPAAAPDPAPLPPQVMYLGEGGRDLGRERANRDPRAYLIETAQSLHRHAPREFDGRAQSSG